jgi:hypothetical protein
MDSVFPFGFPLPTAFYLVLYVATFAFHQAFIHYVVAGSIYVAWATCAPGRGDVPRSDQPLASTLRDWSPFFLSAAITAGVAPLLFVQILYPTNFYTANLLLSWRWMIVIPILIVAFYLLYLVKNSTISKWPYAARAAVVIVVASCFLFVGFCWTTNHLVANNEADWPAIYASGQISIVPSAVTLRMLIWLGGAFAGTSVIAAWQLAARRTSSIENVTTIEVRRLACCSLAGLAMVSIAACLYLMQSEQSIRGLILGPFALPYALAALIGVLAQAVSWAAQLRVGLNRWFLASASIAYVVTLVSISVLREVVRSASVDIAELYERHAQAGTIGGFVLFLLFAVLNGALIATCIGLVRHGLAKASDA